MNFNKDLDNKFEDIQFFPDFKTITLMYQFITKIENGNIYFQFCDRDGKKIEFDSLKTYLYEEECTDFDKRLISLAVSRKDSKYVRGFYISKEECKKILDGELVRLSSVISDYEKDDCDIKDKFDVYVNVYKSEPTTVYFGGYNLGTMIENDHYIMCD